MKAWFDVLCADINVYISYLTSLSRILATSVTLWNETCSVHVWVGTKLLLANHHFHLPFWPRICISIYHLAMIQHTCSLFLASPRKCYPAIIPFSPRYSETSPPWPPLNSQRKGSTSHLPAEDRFVDGSEILPTSWERNEYASRCSRNRKKTQNHQGIWGKKRSACSQ